MRTVRRNETYYRIHCAHKLLDNYVNLWTAAFHMKNSIWYLACVYVVTLSYIDGWMELKWLKYQSFRFLYAEFNYYIFVK